LTPNKNLIKFTKINVNNLSNKKLNNFSNLKYNTNHIKNKSLINLNNR